MQTKEQTYRKMYVDVIALHDTDGVTKPIKMRLEDGTKVTIDRVKYCQRAASTKVGGSGIRYTIVIRGLEHYLFEDEGKWFVEAREEQNTVENSVT